MTLSEKFYYHYNIWIKQSCMTYLDFHYQNIINLGPNILPFLLKELKYNHNYNIIYAIEMIIGSDEPLFEDYEDYRKITLENLRNLGYNIDIDCPKYLKNNE